MKYLACAAAALLLTGCATTFDGRYQDITLETNLDGAGGALCSIERNGVELVPASPTPATHQIPKRRGNLIVTCNADGYQETKKALVNGKHPMAVTGIMLTGMLVNVGTDAIAHGWHEAQNKAYIHLVK